MKNMLLLLLTLTLTPAWAAETAQPAEPQPAATTQTTPATEPGTAAPATPDGATAACPKTCVVMSCPPPNGTMKLCCPVAPYTQTCP